MKKVYWLDFYKNKFIEKLESVNQYRNSDYNVKELCCDYVNLVNFSGKLIQLYINSQGLFHFELREIIKEAFYIGLVEDGEKWMGAIAFQEMFKSDKNGCYDLIAEYCKDENFIIFNELNDKFKKIAEEYE